MLMFLNPLTQEPNGVTVFIQLGTRENVDHAGHLVLQKPYLIGSALLHQVKLTLFYLLKIWSHVTTITLVVREETSTLPGTTLNTLVSLLKNASHTLLELMEQFQIVPKHANQDHGRSTDVLLTLQSKPLLLMKLRVKSTKMAQWKHLSKSIVTS